MNVIFIFGFGPVEILIVSFGLFKEYLPTKEPMANLGPEIVKFVKFLPGWTGLVWSTRESLFAFSMSSSSSASSSNSSSLVSHRSMGSSKLVSCFFFLLGGLPLLFP